MHILRYATSDFAGWPKNGSCELCEPDSRRTTSKLASQVPSATRTRMQSEFSDSGCSRVAVSLSRVAQRPDAWLVASLSKPELLVPSWAKDDVGTPSVGRALDPALLF